MRDDVTLNKCEVIKRCIKRVQEVYQDTPSNLDDFTKQDSIILNIQRLCEASIDLAMHFIKEKKLTIPQTSREAFETLFENKVITGQLSKNLQAMVGFRNIAVHDYQAINLVIVQKVIENHLNDSLELAEIILQSS